MQISRSVLVACAAVCTTTLALGANDTPEQIKAREAVRQKIQESQPPPAPPATPADSDAAAKAREAVRQAPPPVAPPPAPPVASDAPVPPPAPAVHQADSESIAKAREAVRQKIGENQVAAPSAVPAAAPAPTPPPPPPVVIVPPPAAPAATASSHSAAMQSTPAPGDSAEIARAREAMRQHMYEDNEVGPKADSVAIARARESVRQRMQSITYADPTSSAGNPSSMNFPPLEGPPLPISSDKYHRLNELLQRYKADQVTPEQYQVERAKILAGP